MTRPSLIRLIAFWVAVVFYALPAPAQQGSLANSSKDVLHEDVLQQILVELRSVRETLDRTLASQSQLLLWSEQVKFSYQIVTAKSDRLEGARGQAALVHAELLQATRTADGFEGQIAQIVDQDQKTNLERQAKEQKALIAECQQRETGLREDEARFRRELQDAEYKMDQAVANLAAIANQIQQDTKRASR